MFEHVNLNIEEITCSILVNTFASMIPAYTSDCGVRVILSNVEHMENIGDNFFNVERVRSGFLKPVILLFLVPNILRRPSRI